MSRPAIWFLSFAALAVLIVAAAALAVPEIERDLEDAARRTLAEQGLQDAVSVRADGRDLLVASDEPALAKRAATVLAGVQDARAEYLTPRSGAASKAPNAPPQPAAIMPVQQSTEQAADGNAQQPAATTPWPDVSTAPAPPASSRQTRASLSRRPSYSAPSRSGR
ncbi:MAG TPA: hypothetical protein EYQ24_01825 [Bacteroidetes bacterium]|nr:hypothetical protein [Bacteroidota bacterium]